MQKLGSSFLNAYLNFEYSIMKVTFKLKKARFSLAVEYSLIVSLVLSHLGFWDREFLIALFPKRLRTLSNVNHLRA